MIRKQINAKTFKHLLQRANACSFSIGAGESSWIIRKARTNDRTNGRTIPERERTGAYL